MYKNDAKLFGEAVLNGIINRFDRELANNTESDLCSEEHKAAMLDVMLKAQSVERRINKKRLIAIIVAAALLLVGCTAYVYRNEIGSFVENIYKEYVKIELPEDGDSLLAEIEHVYTLTYVPEGYDLVENIVDNVGVRYMYVNGSGEKIIFDQSIKNSTSIGIDNDDEKAEVIKYKNLEIYLRTTDYKKHYVWYDENYAFKLVCFESLSQAEILKIIDEME